tara:strand:+ start:421 stop:537 length:117 start_codon:yes stop_codon:yes gene_type:complete
MFNGKIVRGKNIALDKGNIEIFSGSSLIIILFNLIINE